MAETNVDEILLSNSSTQRIEPDCKDLIIAK